MVKARTCADEAEHQGGRARRWLAFAAWIEPEASPGPSLRWLPPLALAIAAAIILAFVVSGNGSPVLVGRTEHNRAGAASW